MVNPQKGYAEIRSTQILFTFELNPFKFIYQVAQGWFYYPYDYRLAAIHGNPMFCQ